MVSIAIPDTLDHKLEGYIHVLPVAESRVEAIGDRLFCLVLREVSPGVFERIGSLLSNPCYLIKGLERQMTLV